MTLTATYDGQLSRVRLTAGMVLTTNPYFETDMTGWEVAGGTFVRSTAQAHTGVASGLLTPDGVAAEPVAATTLATSPAVTVGEEVRFTVWVRSAVARDIKAAIQFFTAADVVVSSVTVTVAVAATTWTQLSVIATVPATAAKARPFVSIPGTPPGSATLHIDDAELYPTAVTVERSTNGTQWTTVRGGGPLPVPTGGVAKLDDYEFAPDVANTYRARGQTTQITPTLTGVWIKSIARPWLNRQVTVVDYSEVERPARAGVFDIVGRSMPIAVSDVRGSRRYELEILTETADTFRDFDLAMASGDPILVHVPATSLVPAGYFTVGDVASRRVGRTSIKRVFTLPLIEIAAPGPDVVGAAVTWQTVVNAYATWQDVLNAHPTWSSVLELIGSPSEVIVP